MFLQDESLPEQPHQSQLKEEDSKRNKHFPFPYEPPFEQSPAIPKIPQPLNHRDPMSKFFQSAKEISLEPVNSSENCNGNYNNYVTLTLQGINKIKSLDFSSALTDPSLHDDINGEVSRFVKSNRKILLLDLDETLIHADFEEAYPINTYDAMIRFKSEEEEISVGIFIRKGLNQFLMEVSKEFEIGIFTASCKEYADAVLDYIDPNNLFFKLRLYRNSCISIKKAVNVKDLRVIEGINLDKVVIVDNSMYSFANQLSNGILINSFYNDKDDDELFNVMSYLMTYISGAKDVREVNEQFFNFEEISKQLTEDSRKDN